MRTVGTVGEEKRNRRTVESGNFKSLYIKNKRQTNLL